MALCPKCGATWDGNPATCFRCGGAMGTLGGGYSGSDQAQAALAKLGQVEEREAASALLKPIKTARITILVVAIINLLASVLLFLLGGFLGLAARALENRPHFAAAGEDQAPEERVRRFREAVQRAQRRAGIEIEEEEEEEDDEKEIDNDDEREVGAAPWANGERDRPVDPAAAAKGAVGKVYIAAVFSFLYGATLFGLFFWAKKNPFGATLTALILWILGVCIDLPGIVSEGSYGVLLLKILIAVTLCKGVLAGQAYNKAQAAA